MTKTKTTSWGEISKEAKNRPTVLPNLTFGENKVAEGVNTVRFLESEPREIEYTDKRTKTKKQAYAINVQLISSTFGSQAPGRYSLVMNGKEPGKELHGLTAGVGKVADEAGGDLQGICADIITRNYDHKDHGETRGYTVVAIKDPEAETDPMPAQ